MPAHVLACEHSIDIYALREEGKAEIVACSFPELRPVLWDDITRRDKYRYEVPCFPTALVNAGRWLDGSGTQTG